MKVWNLKGFKAAIKTNQEAPLNIRTHAAKIAAVAILPIALSATAHAQSANYVPSPALAFKASTGNTNWHNILVVSAIVLGAGLLTDNSTLTTLGGLGVLISLVETNGNTSFRYRSVPSLEMMHFGQVSFGVTPYDQIKLSQGVVSPHPSFILQTKFKF